MLEITIPSTEMWDESRQEFVTIGKPVTLQLEHSLVSISKWESKWHIPFIVQNKQEEMKFPKTTEMMYDYVRCMTLNKGIDPKVYYAIPSSEMQKVNEYINNSMTATTFKDIKKKQAKRSSEYITSELIYYWMVSLEIPFECQKWHLNRLLALIRICNEKNDSSANKMSKKDILKNQAALNAARKAKYHTHG